jgi:DNA primase
VNCEASADDARAEQEAKQLAMFWPALRSLEKMPNPGSFADAVKQQADIVRVIGDYVRLKKTGAQNFGGLCPFHKEKTPSFSVHATRQFFHCFGCGVSGDVFSFVQKIENITFPEAVRAVAQKIGMPPPKQTFSGPEEAREARLRGALLDMHERACNFFQEQLRRPEAAAARQYLAGRGLEQKTIDEFRIGYAPDSGFLLRDALKGSFDEASLRESGLFSWKEGEAGQAPAAGNKQASIYSKFRGRIIFPICNDQGKVIAFTGRRLSADEKAGPKYLNSPETAIYSKSRVLFNLEKAKEHIRALDYAILVEGQMDCIALFSHDLKNVIASSGTAFTDQHARLLGRFTRKVVVNFDPDTAGAAATERTLGLLVEEDFAIKVLRLEHGLDPDLFIRRQGRAAYDEALRRAPKYFDYLIDRAQKQFPPRSPEAKHKAVNFLLPHLQRVPHGIVRDELAADMAQKLGIDSGVLRQELRRAAATRAGSIKAPVEPGLTDSERILIRALAPVAGDSHETAEYLRDVLLTERLHDHLAGEALISALLQEGVLTEAEQRLLNSVLMREEEQLSTELIRGAVDALRQRKLARESRSIQIEVASSKLDPLEQARVAMRKIETDKEQRRLRGWDG